MQQHRGRALSYRGFVVTNFRKFAARSASSLLLTSLFSLLLLPSLFAREREPQKFSKQATANLETRKTQIQRELSSLNVDSWAGQYYYGDGLGVNVELSLAPKSGFAFTWNGCLGLYDMNYGDLEESDGKIRLFFKLPNEHKPLQGIASEFVPVVWGNRHYLIASDEVVKFANAINAGFEPREGAWGEFLLKRQDVSKSANGKPNLPSEYSEYLLKHPIDAEISSIKGSHTEKTGRLTTVMLNVGASQGVKKGMEFYLYAPSGLFESATVTNMNGRSVEAEIFQCCDDRAAPPAVGWKLSTHVGHAE
jgi:hypothetical protein